MDERSGRLDLLRRTPALRTLIGARLASEAGNWLAYIALTVDVYARTGSGRWVGAVLIAGFLPTVVGALLLGPFVDRIPRKRLLVSSDLAGMLVFAALPFASSALAVVGLAALAGLAIAVYYPSLAAATPNLVDDRDLPTANSLSLTVATAGIAIGPLLAGVLIGVEGVRAAYLLNAASFLVSAILIGRIPARLLHSEQARGDSHWRELRVGLQAIAAVPLLRRVLGVWILAAVAGAAINVGEILLAKDVFGAGTRGFGVLASATGVGLVAGSVASSRIVGGRPPETVYPWALALGAAGFAAAALSPSIWVASVFAAAATFGNSLVLASQTLIVQRAVPDRVRGRAFSLFASAGDASMATGMVVAGALTAAVDARAIWLWAAGLLFLAALVTRMRRPVAATLARRALPVRR